MRKSLPNLNDSEHAWLSRHVKELNWTVEDLCKDLRENKGLDVDPASLEEFLKKKGLSPVRSSADSHMAVRSGTVVRRTVTDKYVKMAKDTKFRAEVAERIGIGFELPKAEKVEVVPSVPNSQKMEAVVSV